MDNNKFFKWIWRLNGLIVFFGVGLVLVIVVYEMARPLFRETPEEQIITSVADDPEGEEKWVLGHPKGLSSSDYIAIPLVSENDKIASKKSRGHIISSGGPYWPSGTAKNILFINTKSNEASWLFPSNNQLIDSFSEFPSVSKSEKKKNEDIQTLIFYVLINKDTNGDGMLSADDKLNLAVSDTNGNNLKVLMQDIDYIVGKSMAGSSEIFVIYQKAGVGYSMKLRISDHKIISNLELPKVS